MDSGAAIDALLDLEIMLVTKFGWNLHNIDETAVDSLIMFINRVVGSGKSSGAVYCDDVDWL